MKTFSILLFCLFQLSSYSQLSEAWLGNYQGELFATNLAGIETTYSMELDVSKINETSYNWVITYGADSTKQVRAYQLNFIGMNLYEMDEQNGILLKVSYNNNALTSVFEVEDNLLHVIYRITKKGVLFELTSSNGKTVTGGGPDDAGNTIPAVISYQTIAFQSAFLKRQK